MQTDEVLTLHKTNRAHGLSAETARQRLRQSGGNRLESQEKKPWILRFFAQFKDFMVVALLIAAAISAVSAFVHGSGDYLDSVIITAIVVVNAFVGVIQEGKAERALAALEKMAAPTAQVIRSGKRLRVPAEDVVPGDILVVETGDMIPADARLLESTQLSTQESALTGESMPSTKDAFAQISEQSPPADRKNMVFSGTVVLTGHGVAVVTETGMQTQVGKIAGLLKAEDSPQTPLQIRLEKVGKQLGLAAMAISGLIFLLGFLQHIPLLESFMLAVSLAVAAIPEGLPAMVTVVLSLGVQRMAKQNAIVRRLPAVETLGCASVICSDKTGTLTQNKMTVTQLADARGAMTMHAKEGLDILRLAALCCNAQVQNSGRRQTIIGEPTETAIVDAAIKRRVAVMEDRTAFPRLSENPFDSARKRMSVVCRFDTKDPCAGFNGLTMLCKGAVDVLLPRCSHVSIKGNILPITQAHKGKILAQNDAMANQALRVIALAAKPVSASERSNVGEDALCFMGLIGMNDPPRKEAKAAVGVCRRAGIIPIMITGDHIVTANAIARELGILDAADGARHSMTGLDVDKRNDADLENALRDVRVFARVTPEHKMRIVKALRGMGHVVAMTGDGVNDAPALKAADIGCAMGRSGTEVAKGAADMILTDDNFATIVRAVEQGRGIYENIKKAVRFLISSNIGEIVAVFAASLMRIPSPLLPIQLLWVNVVTDSAPAIALGTEAVDRSIMHQPPKSVNQNFFNGALGFHMLVEGLLMGAVTLLAFVLGRRALGGGDDIALGRTMAFSVLSFVEIAHANNMRSSRSLFAIGPFSNARMNFANLLCIVLQASVVTIAPLCAIFGTVSMTFRQWIAVLGLSILPTVVMEIEKIGGALSRRGKRRRRL
jgi:Ca2+-transporting ATPase